MKDDVQSLSHSKWRCKYHIVFAPKETTSETNYKMTYGRRFTDKDSLVKMIEDYIEYYNNRRLQRNPGVLTPMEKHEHYLAAA